MIASSEADAVDPAAFATAMERIGGFETRPVVAVGVSGGADSTALALLTHQWTRARDGGAIALVVDHGLRPNSGEEAGGVVARLAARGIPSRILSWTGPKPTSGIQEAAREARLGLLADWCHDNGVLHLSLAHHRDDQVETLLMRVARGSGVDGLSGMAMVRWEGSVRILRPFLDLPRERLRATCRAHGETWVEDPSNASPAFARGRLRAASGLLAAEGFRAESLLDTARRATRARTALESSAALLLGKIACFHPEGWATIRDRELLDAPEEIALRALAGTLDAVGGQAYAPRDESLMRLLAGLRQGLDRTRTLGGCVVMPRGGGVVIAREPEAAASTVSLAPGGRAVWDRRLRIDLAATAPANVVIAKLGEEGWRRAAETRDDLVRLGLPLPVRLTLPGLWVGRKLVGVPSFRGPPAGSADYPAEAAFTPPLAAARAAFSPDRLFPLSAMATALSNHGM